MEYLFEPKPPSTLAIIGSELRFPVRRIFCVGRNYADHAREMGADPDREPPFFFSKPADAIVEDGMDVSYPPLTSDLHHEAELVIALDKPGRSIAEADALGHVFGYAAGNDLTRRDLQAAAKKNGQPWDWAKGFDHSAVCGAIRPASEIGHPTTGRIRLTVNGVERQRADLRDMIWPVPAIIAYLSTAVGVEPGDLIYTGTPAGVGPLLPGDACIVEIEGVGAVSTHIAGAAAQ